MNKRIGVIAAAAAGVAALGIGVAAAQTSDNPTPPAQQQPAPQQHPGADGMRDHRGPKGFGGFGPGIHGEFTVPDGNGGYRTMASQMGTVTSVSNTSIAVKSEDGFTRTYAVDEDTMVNAGRDGIADVKQGDRVGVQAIVNGSTAHAIDIRDMTNMKAWHDKFGPQRPQQKPASS